MYSCGDRTSIERVPGVAEVLEHVLLERPDRRVVALDHGVLDGRGRRDVGRELAALGDPLRPAAVEQAHVLVAEQPEDPQRVRRPPVVLVAVDHHGGVAADALGAHQPGEPGAVDVVAGDLVVELGVPVDLDRAGDVPGVVEQHVLVALDDDQPRVAEVFREPAGGDEPFRVRVLAELGVLVEGGRHQGLLLGGLPAS